jgi:hypothetical protein
MAETQVFDQVKAAGDAIRKPAYVNVFAPGYKPLPGPTARGFKTAVGGAKAAAGGLAAVAGDVTGIESLKQYGLGVSQRALADTAQYTMPVEDVDSVGSFVDFAKYAVGHTGGNLLTLLAGGALGRVGGAALARGVPAAAEKLLLKNAGMTAGLGAGAIGQEIGSIYPDAVETGVPDAAARAIIGGTAAGALDMAPAALLASRLGLFGKTLPTAGPRTAGKVAAGVGKGAAIQAGVEGGTEVAQTAIERVAAGRPLEGDEAFSQFLNAGALGAIGGGVFGGVAGGIEAARPGAPAAAPAPGVPAPAPGVPAPPTPAPVEPTPFQAAAAEDLRIVQEPERMALVDTSPSPATAEELQLMQVQDSRKAAQARLSALDAEEKQPAKQRRAKQAIAKDRAAARAEIAALDQRESNLNAIMSGPQYTERGSLARPTIIGEQAAPVAPAAIITPEQDAALRLAEQEAADATRQRQVQGSLQQERVGGGEVRAPAQTSAGHRLQRAAQSEEPQAVSAESVQARLAIDKRLRGELLTSEEVAAVRRFESARPPVVPVTTSARSVTTQAEMAAAGAPRPAAQAPAVEKGKTRLAEPVVLGEKPTAPDTIPAVAQIAKIKQSRGLLLSSEEISAIRRAEPAAATPAIETVTSSSRGAIKQPSGKQARENFVNAYTTAVDSTVADLAAQVEMKPGRVASIKTALKRAAEKAVQQPDAETAQQVLNDGFAAALKGKLPEQDVETFSSKLAEAVAKNAPEIVTKYFSQGAKAPTPTDTIVFSHWGDVPGGVTDPGRIGTGVSGKDWAPAQAVGLTYTSAVVRGSAYNEPAVQTRTPYVGVLDASKVYRADANDPLLAQAREQIAYQFGPDNGIAWMQYAKNVRDMGYDAMLYANGQLRIFTPQPVMKLPGKQELSQFVTTTVRTHNTPDNWGGHGSTHNMVTGQNLAGTKNYAVSPHKDREVVVPGKIVSESMIRSYVEANLDLLMDPRNTLGTWYNDKDGNTYIDVSVTTPSLESAMAFARQANQLAIFDLRTFTEIPADHPVFTSAQAYNQSAGLMPIHDTPYIQVNPELGSQIARTYEGLQARNDDPAVAQAYSAFAAEIEAQFDAASKVITIEPWTAEGQPYADSAEMRADVFTPRKETGLGHIYVFEGGEPHPFLTPEQNWKFRAIHDIYGHAKTVFEFGPRGELNATRAHAQMFSPAAIPALVTETIGQNSWVNFSEANAGLPAEQRAFAAQKADLLPESLWTPLLEDGKRLQSHAAARLGNQLAHKGVKMLEALESIVGTPARLMARVVGEVEGGTGSITFGQARDVIAMSVHALDGTSLAAHEGYHYLEQRVLNRDEKAIISRAFKRGSSTYNALMARAREYDRVNGTNISDEIAGSQREATAYGYEFWNRGELTATSTLERVWQKIKQVAERIANAVRGLGFQSQEDIFRAIQEGQYAQRGDAGLAAYAPKLASRGAAARRYEVYDKRTFLTVDKGPFPTEDLPAPYDNKWLREQGIYGMREIRPGAFEKSAAAAPSSPAFKKWFGKSLVVGTDGKPLVVYRGEHGETADQFHSRLPSLSFGSVQAAETYALSPNDDRDLGRDLVPRIYPVFLRIENPVINSTDDPFVDLDTLISALGRDEAGRIARKFSGSIEYTSNWLETINPNDEYRDLGEFLDKHPERLGELYFEAYHWLDDHEEVARLKALGYDGAIHGGSGDTALETEYKVFDAAQAKSAIGNDGSFDATNPDILFSQAGTARVISVPAWELGEVREKLLTVADEPELLESYGMTEQEVRDVAATLVGTKFDATGRSDKVLYLVAEEARDAAQIIEDGAEYQESPAKAKRAARALSRFADDVEAMMTNPGILFSQAATADSLADMALRVQAGELPRTQLNIRMAEVLDDKTIPNGLKEKLFDGAADEFRAWGGSAKRMLAENILSGQHLSRKSSGYRNVFGVLTSYVQRKNVLIADAVEKRLSTWVTGASKEDKVAVSAALLTRTENGWTTGSEEYLALRSGLNDAQRAMFDQATEMISSRLDAELEAEIPAYRKVLDEEAFAEWYANRHAQVERLKAEGYFPERRFGDHVVHAYVTAPDGKKVTAYFAQHESEADARRELDELNRLAGNEGLTFEYGYRYRAEYDGSISFGQFLTAAERVGVKLTQMERERIGKALISADSTRRNRVFRRKNIAGYSQDGMRILAEFGVTMANKIAYAELGEAINDAMAGRRVDVAFDNRGQVKIDTLADSNVWELDGPEAGFYRNVADETVSFVLSPREDSNVSSKLRGAATAHFLGGSIAAGLVNLSSLPMNTVPWLSQHTNYADAMAKVLGAVKTSAANFNAIRDLPTLMDTTKRLDGIDDTEGLRHALQVAAQDGTILDTEIYQIMGLSRGQEYSMSGAVQKAVQVWMTPFRLAEQMNRMATFIAAYKVAKGNNLDNDAAYTLAQETVYSTQFRYDDANRPALARGDWTSILFVFKSYPIFVLETMSFLAKENPRAAAFMLGSLVMVAGIQGLPFAEDLEDLIDTIAQRLFGSPFNSQRWLRNTLKTASEAVTGTDLSSIFMHGIVNTMTELNFASRVGLGNLIPGTRIGAADADYKSVMTEVIGPVGSMVGGVLGGVDALNRGAFVEAARKALPLGAQNFVKGAQQWNSGFATDIGGRKLVDVSGWEAFWQSFGMSSAAVSSAYTADRIDRQVMAYYQAARGVFQSGIVKAVKAGDAGAIKDATDAVIAWNEAHPDMPMSISPATIRRAVTQAGMTLNQRTLEKLPKQLRGTSEAALGLDEGE